MLIKIQQRFIVRLGGLSLLDQFDDGVSHAVLFLAAPRMSGKYATGGLTLAPVALVAKAGGISGCVRQAGKVSAKFKAWKRRLPPNSASR